MSDERFARQYRFGLPPRFPLASSCTSIVHHLSGPNIHAQARSVSPGGSQTADHVTMCMIQSISLRTRVYNSNTRTYVRLLGPCFKTGRMTTPWWRQDAERTENETKEKDFRLVEKPINSESATCHKNYDPILQHPQPKSKHSRLRLTIWEADTARQRYAIRFHLTISRTFNVLFKVLFIFPSRYLFAIGLLEIFSFRRILPPNLCCSPKQHDSQSRFRMYTQSRQTGILPSMSQNHKKI